VILEKDCLAKLICAYNDLAASRKVAAIMPRMITENDADSTKSEGKEVVVFSKWTGLDKPQYHIDLEGRVRIPSGHACSLIAKQAWSQVGGYDETRYKGTCFREETDFYLRTGQKGYEIYFEPKAIIYHLKYRSGGCHSSPLKDDYYYARNQVLFLLRFHKLRSTYMIPIFVLYLGVRLIGRRFRL
jgi:GT2 family glycosyltransferase